MSVTFGIVGSPYTEIDSEDYLNLSNVNARSLFEWIGVDGGEYLGGSIRARLLCERCRAALAQGVDTALPSYEEGENGTARVIFCGRREGYLEERTRQLLALAEKAGELGVISWG